MRTEVRISGIGGQGVVYGADLLGLAASEAHHSVAVSASYGAEARGTSTAAEVVISDKPIDYPCVELPNYLILMHQKAYASLHDKLACFRNSHEVPGYIFMRYCYWPAFFNLLLKNRNDTAAASEDIPEPNGAESCF